MSKSDLVFKIFIVKKIFIQMCDILKPELLIFNWKTQQKNNRLRALHGFRLLLDGGQHRVLGSGDVTHQPPDVTVAQQRELVGVPDVVGEPPPSVIPLSKLVARPFLTHHPLDDLWIKNILNIYYVSNKRKCRVSAIFLTIEGLLSVVFRRNLLKFFYTRF